MTCSLYLDVANEVLAHSKDPLDLAAVQVIHPTAALRLDNIPTTLDIRTKDDPRGYVSRRIGAGGNQADWQLVVNPPILEQIKGLRHQEIATKTQALVDVLEFEWPAASGNIFITSPGHRDNWHSMFTFKDFLAYPFPVQRKDFAPVMLADATELQNFSLAGLGVIQPVVQAAQPIHDQIIAATTPEEVAAVVDPR